MGETLKKKKTCFNDKNFNKTNADTNKSGQLLNGENSSVILTNFLLQTKVFGWMRNFSSESFSFVGCLETERNPLLPWEKQKV